MNSPVVIIALTEVFDGTVPSKILFPFPWNSYLKTDGTSLIILFLVKNFEEKEIEFLKEQFGKNFCKMMASVWKDIQTCLNSATFSYALCRNQKAWVRILKYIWEAQQSWNWWKTRQSWPVQGWRKDWKSGSASSSALLWGDLARFLVVSISLG